MADKPACQHHVDAPHPVNMHSCLPTLNHTAYGAQETPLDVRALRLLLDCCAAFLLLWMCTLLPGLHCGCFSRCSGVISSGLDGRRSSLARRNHASAVSPPESAHPFHLNRHPTLSASNQCRRNNDDVPRSDWWDRSIAGDSDTKACIQIRPSSQAAVTLSLLFPIPMSAWDAAKWRVPRVLDDAAAARRVVRHGIAQEGGTGAGFPMMMPRPVPHAIGEEISAPTVPHFATSNGDQNKHGGDVAPGAPHVQAIEQVGRGNLQGSMCEGRPPCQRQALPTTGCVAKHGGCVPPYRPSEDITNVLRPSHAASPTHRDRGRSCYEGIHSNTTSFSYLVRDL